MDAVDRKLLTLLQQDSRATAEQLSERLHLSPSAITRRVQRLWADGSISAEVIVLGEKLRAQRVTAIIHVQLDRHQPAQAVQFRRTLQAAPEVQLCVEITGASDVLMVVSAHVA
jgi:DNA-binding Lrp family transcriptional regulator